MNRKFVSKSNLVLRNVLNNENSLDILQNFIESILKIKIQKIRLNPYLKIRSKFLPSEENFGIADVRITTTNNEELNVGIQFIDGIYVQNKLLLYYAQIHTNQLIYDENRKIAKTITINILDFSYFNTTDYHKIIKIGDNEQLNYLEKLELHIIELPKYKYDIKRKLSEEEAWIGYLVGNRIDLIKKITAQNEKIKKLDKLLDNYWKLEKME